MHDHDDQIQEEVWSPEGQWLTRALNDGTPRLVWVKTDSDNTLLAALRRLAGEIREVEDDDNELPRQISERLARWLS